MWGVGALLLRETVAHSWWQPVATKAMCCVSGQIGALIASPHPSFPTFLVWGFWLAVPSLTLPTSKDEQ